MFYSFMICKRNVVLIGVVVELKNQLHLETACNGAGRDDLDLHLFRDWMSVSG